MGPLPKRNSRQERGRNPRRQSKRSRQEAKTRFPDKISRQECETMARDTGLSGSPHFRFLEIAKAILQSCRRGKMSLTASNRFLLVVSFVSFVSLSFGIFRHFSSFFFSFRHVGSFSAGFAVWVQGTCGEIVFRLSLEVCLSRGNFSV